LEDRTGRKINEHQVRDSSYLIKLAVHMTG
jgi:hypothetical protein